MAAKAITALLVEDNPADARLIKELLAEAENAAISLESVTHLSTGLERLSRGGIDVVILDLNLPDSWGLRTLARVREQAPEIPVVVLTGLDNAEAGNEAVKQGAQDYITKNRLQSFSLVHSIRFAMLRHDVQEEAQKVRTAVGEDKYSRAATHTKASRIPLTPQTFGPTKFDDLQKQVMSQRLVEAVDGSVGQQGQMLPFKLSSQLRALAVDLGKLGAGPADVLDIYVSCLQPKAGGPSAKKRKAWDEHGPWVVAELLGHLAADYRNAVR